MREPRNVVFRRRPDLFTRLVGRSLEEENALPLLVGVPHRRLP